MSESQDHAPSITAVTSGQPETPHDTFSVYTEPRRACIAGMIDDERSVVIRIDPRATKTEAGTNVRMGFPILVVTGWVAEPEEFAAKVAKLLEEHQP